jgi:hypothetical protein
MTMLGAVGEAGAVAAGAIVWNVLFNSQETIAELESKFEGMALNRQIVGVGTK